MPTVRQVDRGVWHKEAKVFAADHEYHVNSISPSSNTDNFITADDLTVHLWDLAHHEQSLRVVDRKPEHMEDLSETITASTFHPKDPCTFCVASSKGILTIYDLRQNLTLSAPARILPGPPMSAPNVYLSSILAGISHVQYSPCGTYLAARDYMSVKIWDARREGTPVKEFRVHDHLQPRVTELYETDCMFDRFELAYTPSGRQLYTGSYRSEFTQFAVDSGDSRLYQHIDAGLFQPRAPAAALRGQGGAAPPPPKPHEEEDFKKKALHVAAHPNDDIVAVASGHELYLHVRPDAASAAAAAPP